MDNKEKKRIKRQLESQIVMMDKQNDESIALSAISTCKELLKLVAGMPASSFGETGFDTLYADYLSIAKSVEDFHKTASERPAKGSSSERKNGVIENLKLAIMEANADQMSQAEAERELQALRQSNLKTEAEIARLQASIQNEKKRSVTLQNSKNGATQKAEAQKESNDTLIALLEEQKKNHARLEKEEQDLLRQNEKVQKEIDKTQAAIDALPAEHASLIRRYEEKKAELAKLERAKIDYGPTQQESLQREIEKLLPVVEELRATHDELRKRQEDLRTQKTTFDRKNQTLSTNVLDQTKAALSSIGRVLDEHHEVLTAVKEKADALSEKTKRCMEMRDGYRSWFGTQETPLKAMMRALALPENSSLQETLDVGTLENVKTLMEKIKNDLNSLDEILRACSVAVREDRQNVLRRTHI